MGVYRYFLGICDVLAHMLIMWMVRPESASTSIADMVEGRSKAWDIGRCHTSGYTLYHVTYFGIFEAVDLLQAFILRGYSLIYTPDAG